MWRRKLELELELELVTESGASSLQWPPVASHEIYALKLHNWATHTHRHRVTQTGETLHINSGSQGNGEKFLTRPHPELKLNSLGPYQIKHFLVLGRLLIEVRTRRCTDTRIQRSMCSDTRFDFNFLFRLVLPQQKKPLEFVQSHTVGCHFIASLGICK